MKKLLCVLLVLLILIPAASAETTVLVFSTAGSTEDVSHIFGGDYFHLTILMSSDLKAEFVETIWKKGEFLTRSYPADIRSKKGDSKNLYFVLNEEFTVTGHYDENGMDFWIDYIGGSVKLHPVEEFNSFFDYLPER